MLAPLVAVAGAWATWVWFKTGRNVFRDTEHKGS